MTLPANGLLAPNVFHYTGRIGWNAIRSQPTWTFQAGQPPDPERPRGAYFTDIEPTTVNLRLLSKRIRVPKIKQEYIFWFVGTEGRTRLNQGRGRDARIFFSPRDYPVPPLRQRFEGLTASDDIRKAFETMMGGIDIPIPARAGAGSLEIAVRAIRHEWPRAVFEDGLTGEKDPGFSTIPFGQVKDFFVYRDADSAALWEAEGAVPEAWNTRIHLILDGDTLFVVADRRDAMLETMLATIRSGLDQGSRSAS